MEKIKEWEKLLNKKGVYLVNTSKKIFYVKQNGERVKFEPNGKVPYTDEVANLKMFFGSCIEVVDYNQFAKTEENLSAGLKDLLSKVEAILEKAKKADKIKEEKKKEKTFSAINEEVEEVINQAQKDIDKFCEVRDIMDNFYACLENIGKITCYEGKERERIELPDQVNENINNQPDPANENK